MQLLAGAVGRDLQEILFRDGSTEGDRELVVDNIQILADVVHKYLSELLGVVRQNELNTTSLNQVFESLPECMGATGSVGRGLMDAPIETPRDISRNG
jgi:hypothetical protein